MLNLQTGIRAILLASVIGVCTTAHASERNKLVVLQVKGSSTTMYSMSHPHSKKLVTLPKNEKWLVQIIQKRHTNGVWVKIDYNGQKGWVKKKHLKLDNQAILIAKKHKHCLTYSQRNKICFKPPEAIAKK